MYNKKHVELSRLVLVSNTWDMEKVAWSNIAEEKQFFELAHIGQIRGATWRPLIGPHVTL
jgi:hypothetical protein